jgi:hypothetical protein
MKLIYSSILIMITVPHLISNNTIREQKRNLMRLLQESQPSDFNADSNTAIRRAHDS